MPRCPTGKTWNSMDGKCVPIVKISLWGRLFIILLGLGFFGSIYLCIVTQEIIYAFGFLLFGLGFGSGVIAWYMIRKGY